MYADLDIKMFFSGTLDEPVAIKSKTFCSKNARIASRLQSVFIQGWDQRKLSQKITRMSAISKQPIATVNTKKLLYMWEAINKEVGKIFTIAEQSFKRPKKTKHLWSPELAQAGREKRH